MFKPIDERGKRRSQRQAYRSQLDDIEAELSSLPLADDRLSGPYPFRQLDLRDACCRADFAKCPHENCVFWGEGRFAHLRIRWPRITVADARVRIRIVLN